MRKRLALLALVLFAVSTVLAEVRLPAVVGSHMVLQRDTQAPIWGWADPGQKVTLRAQWQGSDTVARADKDGRWSVQLPTPSAGGPYTITIEGPNRIVLEDVLIGEVWVCSGQSNMAFTTSSAINGAQEVAAADYPKIRLFNVARKVAEAPMDDCQGTWQACSPETVGGFSAVGYFFGRELYKELNVPIGLIESAWGGTPAEAWTRREVLEADPEFAPIIERYKQACANFEQAMAEYKQRVEQWKKADAKARAEGQRRPRYPSAPYGPGHPHSPAGLYNGMIAPLIPFAIRGAIWYQGESNASRAYQYRRLFPAMIANWRQDWGRGDFPFYFVQIAPYKNQTPEIREAQLIAYRTTPNTGIAVTMDIGNPDNIHPKNKQDVGKRLALWALAKTYGRKGLVYSGPLYKYYQVEGDTIRIFFDGVGSGLVARDGDLTHFQIAEKDGDFVPAQAKIDGDTVVVWSEQVKHPAAVRYGWENAAEPNLFNKEGLPASPFRTDERPGETYGRF